jgi:hypothetical protein
LAGGLTLDDRFDGDYNDIDCLCETTDDQDSGRTNNYIPAIIQEPLMRSRPGRVTVIGGFLAGKPKKFTWPAIVLTLMLVVGACGGRQPQEPVLGTDQTLSGPATLICGQACSERAQCGLADQQQTVLLSSTGPATAGFNMAVASGTEVLIIQQLVEPVVQVSNQESQRVPFYQVDIPDVGAGWVAGWCILQ